MTKLFTVNNFSVFSATVALILRPCDYPNGVIRRECCSLNYEQILPMTNRDLDKNFYLTGWIFMNIQENPRLLGQLKEEL